MGNALPCHKRSSKARASKHRPEESEDFGEGQSPSMRQLLSNYLVVKEGEKEVVRVKMVLTKKEAARLLSMYAGQGEKAAADRLAAEVGKIELGRSDTFGAQSDRYGWRPALESIPEYH